MTIVVTGAAGFIGSNIIKGLNDQGHFDILAVDDLTQADKFKNIVDLQIEHYLNKDEFLRQVHHHILPFDVDAVFHEGACSDTMETDGAYMMQNNYQYSLDLLDWCNDENIPFIYASSAAVYGKSEVFSESYENESPLNVYGYSKFLFDQVVTKRLKEKDLKTQVVGLRYFNVYGAREQHKGKMASVAFHHFNQYHEHGFVNLFEGYDGYENGAQTRDFVSVEDVVKVNLFFLSQPLLSGIFNLGTGKGQSFNELAAATVNACRQANGEDALTLKELQDQELIRYIPFPNTLKGKYQSFTEANINRLRNVGYDQDFFNVEEGVRRYVDWMQSH